MKINMKYKLTKNFITQNNKKLYQIQSLKNFLDVKIGEFGGYIESEKNLSQEGDCWIYDDARVYGKAKVYDDAKVSNNAEVYDTAEVSSNALVFGNGKVFGNGSICGDLFIS
jgi:hypothetical protein